MKESTASSSIDKSPQCKAGTLRKKTAAGYAGNLTLQGKKVTKSIVIANFKISLWSPCSHVLGSKNELIQSYSLKTICRELQLQVVQWNTVGSLWSFPFSGNNTYRSPNFSGCILVCLIIKAYIPPCPSIVLKFEHINIFCFRVWVFCQ